MSTAPNEGPRLDAALAARGLAPSRAAAQKMIEQGRVLVDGRPKPKSHLLTDDEELTVTEAVAPPEPAEVPPVDFEVVHEDADVLVIEKPPGVVVHPGAGNATGTLVQALAGRVAGGTDPERPGLIHRLDRDTSGLLVLARNEEAYAALSDAMREREIERRYVALVAGRPDALAGMIDAPIGRDRSRRTSMSTHTDNPRPAITHFELREQLPRTALLDVRLETGRTHQIRAHMAAIDLPVCGDERYGGAIPGRRIGLTRQFLHAAQLMFIHPRTGEPVHCESDLPADLVRSLELARREPVPGGPDRG